MTKLSPETCISILISILFSVAILLMISFNQADIFSEVCLSLNLIFTVALVSAGIILFAVFPVSIVVAAYVEE